MKNLLKLNSLCLLVFGIFICASSCFAQINNSCQPRIKAKKIVYNAKKQVTYFKENVVVRHGDVTLVADNATAYQKIEEAKDETDKESKSKNNKEESGNIKRIVAVGNVRIKTKNILIISNKAVWDKNKQTVTLTGGPPTVKNANGYLTADKILYELNTDNVTFYPNPEIIIGIGKEAKAKFLE